MSISFKTQTITVIRAAVVVERGDDMLDWSNTTEHTISRCRLQPMATDEVRFTGSSGSEGGTARDAVVTRWRLFAPPASDLTALDRVRYAGVVYEVEGQIQRWPSPTGHLAHDEAVFRRVEG